MKAVQMILLAILFSSVTPITLAQSDSATVYHQIEGRVQHRNGHVRNVRVRLLRMPEMRPIAETFSRSEGQFIFTQVTEGDYSVETFETDLYQATNTNVQVRPIPRTRPMVFTVFIELPLKPPPERVAPGELMADVDLNVPKQAQKHFREGMKKLAKRQSAQAIAEFRSAISIFPNYYSARLELSRELRIQKRYPEAIEVIQPLIEIAPRRAEPRIEYGIVLLELDRRDEAIHELSAALRLEEPNWAAHLFMGWALLEVKETEAESHFQRALELDELKAARAHLALARLANSKGERQLAIDHLEAYLALAPRAHDAEATRRLAELLRSQN